MQAEAIVYFGVWWVLFAYSSFHHFPMACSIDPIPEYEMTGVSHIRGFRSYWSTGWLLNYVLAKCVAEMVS